MKVAARKHFASLRKNQRIISSTATLDFDDLLRVIQSRANCAVYLRHATQTISILHARIVLEMRLPNLALTQQLPQMRRDFNLSRMRARLVNAFVERDGRTLERFERHRARDVCEMSQRFCAIKRQRSDSSHRLRAVEQRQTFLNFQLQWRNLRALESRHRR